MAIYDMRTYTRQVGKMTEATRLYQELGFPALAKGGHDAHRREHWKSVYANKDFIEGFASKFRPLLLSQEVKLLTAAPWGPHP